MEKRKQLDISFLLCDRDYVIWDRDVYQLKCYIQLTMIYLTEISMVFF